MNSSVYYIQIQQTELVYDSTTKKPSHVLYHLECCMNTFHTQTISKRYSELFSFHQQLVKEALHSGVELVKLLHFPPKMFIGNFKEENIEKRRMLLQRYFNQLCSLFTIEGPKPSFQCLSSKFLPFLSQFFFPSTHCSRHEILQMPNTSNERINNSLRKNDVYHVNMNSQEIIQTFQPSSIESTMLSLSAVTGGFYALLLKSMKELYPQSDLNKISQQCFKHIGVLKAREYLSKRTLEMELYQDTRGVVLVLIMAIFNASPEYVFQVEEFSPPCSVITLKGKDRYLRACHANGIAECIEFPTLTQFLEGAAEELNLSSKCHVQAIRLKNKEQVQLNDELHVRYVISLID
ncbi:hypothetical protein C9374_011741 [Naegleria lovaniensis]|uniref:PX domain-containing protein n=1 Tax=Naegleria lovaniensis TaxID=51637 RepID=A0AA88GCC0_NAELO|nr:uncharacterized protein C9374_011741 [Naegleria lovaniensis]KAG2373856.1 hypothetical protein C9374_011741 [Naegleria lovaniensis]